MNEVEVPRKFQVFETVGQTKKHISQMSEKEVNFLHTELKKIDSVRKSKHLLNKMDMVDVPSYIYRDILRNDRRRQIVEYNETINKWTGEVSKRVLIRDTFSVKREFKQAHEFDRYGDAVLCFVIELGTGTIITAYYNFLRDEHITVDMNRYNANLAICA